MSVILIGVSACMWPKDLSICLNFIDAMNFPEDVEVRLAVADNDKQESVRKASRDTLQQRVGCFSVERVVKMYEEILVGDGHRKC